MNIAFASRRDEKLDLIRGISALLVLMGHARNFLFVDSAGILNPNLPSKVFYLLTSLHHQAVMVFFVLSGYFVGGSVLGALRKGKFTWQDYALARMSRLWVVLIPALFLTLGLDLLGRSVVPEAYAGQFRGLFNSGPDLTEPAQLGATTFLGNLFFLQKVLVPVFGTNGPLWSLAYEFWYYVLLPLAVCGLLDAKRGLPSRIIHLAIFAFLLWFLPRGLLVSGLIWLLGVGVWILCQKEWLKKAAGTYLWKFAGALFFAGAMLAAKSGKVPAPDFVVGLSFAVWLPSLLGPWPKPGWWSKLSIGLSDISFSLYIIHFPVMFLVLCTFLRGKLYQPMSEGLIWFAGICVFCLVCSIAFWWLFESRTPVVRKWVKTRISR